MSKRNVIHPNYPSVPAADELPSRESAKAAVDVIGANSIASKAAILLDSVLSMLALKVAEGDVTPALLSELVKLCKASGVDLSRSAQPMSPGSERMRDAVLESMKGIQLPPREPFETLN